MKVVTVNLTDQQIKDVDLLVESGRFASRSAAFRSIILELLKKETPRSRCLSFFDEEEIKIIKTEKLRLIA